MQVTNIASIRRVGQLINRCKINDDHLTKGAPTPERAEAIAALVKSVAWENLDSFVDAIDDLESAGIWIWWGEYRDSAALLPDDPGYGSRSTQRLVVVLAEAEAPPPDVQIDLSHTIGLGPDINDG
jgi:hypothetical protein